MDIFVVQLRLFRAAQSQVAEAAASPKSRNDGASSEDKQRRLKELGVEENTAAALAGCVSLTALKMMLTASGKEGLPSV